MHTFFLVSENAHWFLSSAVNWSMQWKRQSTTIIIATILYLIVHITEPWPGTYKESSSYCNWIYPAAYNRVYRPGEILLHYTIALPHHHRSHGKIYTRTSSRVSMVGSYYSDRLYRFIQNWGWIDPLRDNHTHINTSFLLVFGQGSHHWTAQPTPPSPPLPPLTLHNTGNRSAGYISGQMRVTCLFRACSHSFTHWLCSNAEHSNICIYTDCGFDWRCLKGSPPGLPRIQWLQDLRDSNL